MILKVFSVYDTKTETYMRPFYDPAVGSALRSFGDIAKDSNHVIGQHPTDFALFQLGEWDDKKAAFSPLTAPLHLANAVEFAPSVSPGLQVAVNNK